MRHSLRSSNMCAQTTEHFAWVSAAFPRSHMRTIPSHPIRFDSIRFLPLKHMDNMFCFRSDKIRGHTRRPLHFGLVLRAAHCICSRWLGKALGNSENTPTLWQYTGLAGPILQCLRCYHTNCDYSIADQPLYTLKSKIIYRLYKNIIMLYFLIFGSLSKLFSLTLHFSYHFSHIVRLPVGYE